MIVCNCISLNWSTAGWKLLHWCRADWTNDWAKIIHLTAMLARTLSLFIWNTVIMWWAAFKCEESGLCTVGLQWKTDQWDGERRRGNMHFFGAWALFHICLYNIKKSILISAEESGGKLLVWRSTFLHFPGTIPACIAFSASLQSWINCWSMVVGGR